MLCCIYPVTGKLGSESNGKFVDSSAQPTEVAPSKQTD
jgi:hypothetical protein